MGADTSAVESVVHVRPSHVVVAGCSVMTITAAVAAVATYRRGSKSLMEDGINPSNRLRMLPVAVQTLMLSMFFTGALGTAGFFALRYAGLFSTDVAELPSANEAGRMLRGPRSYIREELARERQTQQQPQEPVGNRNSASTGLEQESKVAA
mmetsp:Transcript_12950/g.22843  ORF Transcript_12950/g.22843 Transcript_12950/m.22843 type:complete len:152 (+) Transcript_12950:91-546(+)